MSKGSANFVTVFTTKNTYIKSGATDSEGINKTRPSGSLSVQVPVRERNCDPTEV